MSAAPRRFHRFPPLVAATLALVLLAHARPAGADALVSVPVRDGSRASARELARLLHRAGAGVEMRVDEGAGEARLFVRAPERALQELRSSGIGWTLVAPDAAAWRRERALRDWRSGAFVGPDELELELRLLAEDRPDLVRLENIGASRQGRPLWAVRVGRAPGSAPAVLLVGATHGDEFMGSEICRRALRMLVDEYGQTPEVTAAVDALAVWMVPMANPDGFVAATRENAAGVDLNRNFGFMWNGAGPTPYSEPETAALHWLGAREEFVQGLAFHTEEAVVNAPWNHTGRRPPDEALLAALGREWARVTGYRYVQGYDWYQTLGDADDHLYGTRGALHLTIETLNRGADTVWAKNRPALLSWLAFARGGIHATVHDAEGRPVAASMRVDGGRPVYARPGRGDVHRPVPPGDHVVEVSANGFLPVRLGVRVEAGRAAELDIELARGGDWHAYAVEVLPFMPVYDDDAQPDVLEVLGAPDGRGFPLAGSMFVVVDAGPDAPLADGTAPGLRVVESGGGRHAWDVFVGETPNGPWRHAGSGRGTATLPAAALPRGRYVRVQDATPTTRTGLVLDAISFVAPDAPLPDAGSGDAGGFDAGSERADGGGSDGPADGGADKHEDELDEPRRRGSGGDAGGCGCGGAPSAVVASALLLGLSHRRARASATRA